MIDAGHALGARARRRRCSADERRVDPAREAEHDVLEAVLLDVVAQCRARAPRRPRPRGSSSSARRRRRARSARRARGRRSSAPAIGAPRAARWRDAAGAGRVSRSRAVTAACEVDVADQQLLANCGAARDHARPRGRSRSEWPSKTSSSWPPTRLQNATAARLSRARWASIRSRSTPLPRVVGRGGDVDDQRRAGQRLVGRGRARAPRCPRRSSARGARSPRSMTRAAVARLEVALLVEHAVVGQAASCGRSRATAPSASTASAL